MKSIVISSGIIAATLMIMASFSTPLSNNLMQNAEAYFLLECEQNGPTITWRADSTVTTAYLDAIKLVMANWNNAPVNMFLDQTTSGEEILLTKSNLGNNGINAITSWPGNDRCNESTGYMNTPATITMNSYYMDGFSKQKKQNTIAHEVGHAIGLAHSDTTGTNDEKTLMYSTDANYNTYKIFVPVLDDIRAAQAWYGSVTSTSECTEFNQNGDVTYTGTCSGSNPALPMNERVTTAGAGNRASASQYSTGQSLPSVGTVLMMAKVDPNTLYRFGLGVRSYHNVADPVYRMATIELDNNGIYASYVDTGGNVQTVTVWSGTPSTSSVYFLEVVVQKDTFSSPAAVYAYQDNGGGSTPPTFLGSASFNSGILWNSYDMYYGTGVWTDSSGNPLSNYDVTQYYNRLRSYT